VGERALVEGAQFNTREPKHGHLPTGCVVEGAEESIAGRYRETHRVAALLYFTPRNGHTVPAKRILRGAILVTAFLTAAFSVGAQVT